MTREGEVVDDVDLVVAGVGAGDVGVVGDRHEVVAHRRGDRPDDVAAPRDLHELVRDRVEREDPVAGSAVGERVAGAEEDESGEGGGEARERTVAEGVRGRVLDDGREVPRIRRRDEDLAAAAADLAREVRRGRIEQHDVILLRDVGVVARRIAARDLEEPAREREVAVLDLGHEDLRDAGVVAVTEEVRGGLEHEPAEGVHHRARARPGPVGDLQDDVGGDALHGGAEEREHLRHAAAGTLERRRRFERLRGPSLRSG